MDAPHSRQTRSFVLRLWVEPGADPRQWRGQLECVGDREKTHFTGPNGLVGAVSRWIPDFQPHTPKEDA